jgi:hypothetical protein
MTLRTVRVECYAGGRSDETPRQIGFDGREHSVARLLAEFVEESHGTHQQTRRFRVLTDEALVLEVVRSSDGEWYMESAPPIEPKP